MAAAMIVVLALCFVGLANPLAIVGDSDYVVKGDDYKPEDWENFKIQFEKKYKSAEEEKMRRDIFLKNLELILEHNAKFEKGEVTYQKGVSHFTDMMPSEFPKGNITFSDKDLSEIEFYQPPYNLEIPEDVDWRTEGLVTDVKNQLQCGSCWAFGSIGGLEGQYAKKNKKLVSLSEQDLVDCDHGDIGCKGGHLISAFRYTMKHGVNTDKAYPYVAKEGTCNFNKSSLVVKNKGLARVIPNEKDLMIAVATVGPIPVCIDASDLRPFRSWIYDSAECSSNPRRADHCVLVVGYGTTEHFGDYWLVKNSWGPQWGEEGYIRMKRSSRNLCGIYNHAIFPTF